MPLPKTPPAELQTESPPLPRESTDPVEILRGTGIVPLVSLRLVVPEKLDALSPGDPRLPWARRDLRIFNRLMGNFPWIADELDLGNDKAKAPHRVLELAAGDGSLGRYLQARFPRWAEQSEWIGLDLSPRPADWPSSWAWHEGDLLRCDAFPSADVIVANHILHQFTDSRLRTLAPRLRDASPRFVFNETARGTWPLGLARASALLGLHPISRHDAVVSIRAGFRGEELADLLGLSAAGWTWHQQTTLRGAYRLTAQAPSR